MDSGNSDLTYQDQILPHVSRTFALTIPQLPAALRTAVTNAYLLCRIADTIEDEPALSPVETLQYLGLFKDLVASGGDSAPLVRELAQRLSERTLPAERDLVIHMQRIIAVKSRLGPGQRAAIERCVELMCYGMPRFQSTASLNGLARMADMDDYCYYVAGVVGEMLTDLFCDHDPAIAANRPRLSALAASFAQGLQMTNILKDLWEDRSRGACWLPQDVFSRHGVDLASLSALPHDEGFAAGLQELVGVTHAHLRNALDYTLFIPATEPGIRRFCLWAIGLAVLTLQKIHRNPRFTAGSQVKVPRSAVRATRSLVELSLRREWMLRRLFAFAARGLPLETLGDLRRPHVSARPTPVAAGHDSGSAFEPRRSAGGTAP